MNIKKLFLLTNIFLAMACMITFLPFKTADVGAATAIKEITAEVNYDEEIITFDDTRSKKVFFSLIKNDDEISFDKIKDWNYVKASDGVVDISTFIGTKETYLAYKDGVNGEIKLISIQAAPKVALDKMESNVTIGQFVLEEKSKDEILPINSCTIEVKKGKRGNWMYWSDNEPFSAFELEYEQEAMFTSWQKSGATIYIRAAADPYDYPASNEISVKIKKLANGPKLTLDPIKTAAKMKKGTEYKVYPVNYDNDSDPDDDLEWISVTETEAKDGILLEDLVNTAKIETADSFITTSSALTIEYRTAETEKKAASKTTIVSVNGQEAGPTVGTKNNKDVKIQMYTANLGSEKRPATGTAIAANEDGYEYKIGTQNLAKGWKALKRDKLVKIKESQASDGNIILFRKKGIRANEKKNISFEWASAYTEKIVCLK